MGGFASGWLPIGWPEAQVPVSTVPLAMLSV
jgi:hypothetical protein